MKIFFFFLLLFPYVKPLSSCPALDSLIRGPKINPLERIPYSGEIKQKLSPRFLGGSGQNKCLVILIDFKSVSETDPSSPRLDPNFYTPTYYKRLLFSQNAGDNLFSMQEYYQEVSYGQCSFSGEVTRWYRSKHTYHYYGADKDPEKGEIDNKTGPINRLAYEAIIELADKDFDFGDYDLNGDKHLTPDELHIIIIHAGKGQEATADPKKPNYNPNNIWSHRWNLGKWTPTNEGVKVAYYTMQAEDSPMGVFAHEMAHDLGVPDLYDIDYSSEGGVGIFCLMAAGSWLGTSKETPGNCPSHPCVWIKYLLGWVKPKEVVAREEEISLQPIEKYPSAVTIIENPGGCDWDWSGHGFGEYFILEYRKKIGADRLLPGEGLLIWHIDEKMPNNSTDSHRLVDLEEADGDNKPGDPGDYWRGGQVFNEHSLPNNYLYNNLPSGAEVKNISITPAEIRATVKAPVRLLTEMYSFPNPFYKNRYQQVTIKYEPNDLVEALKKGELPCFEIYTLTGTLVRRLDQPGVEVFLEKMCAVWDGKDEFGKEVASGMYFFWGRTKYERKMGMLTLIR